MRKYFLQKRRGRGILPSPLLGVLLLFLFTVSFLHFQTFAADPGAGKECRWYTVQVGDNLNHIAQQSGVSLADIAQANYLLNMNLILYGQQLCLPQTIQEAGILEDGSIRWYAYTALESSSKTQVEDMLRQYANDYGLPADLVLAIAWQESGWKQHVIAKDGGIGVMQLMPYTAKALNSTISTRRDPYKLEDNIRLGTYYLYKLWERYDGDLDKVVSAYNEGSWNLDHYGIFNHTYVKSVKALMEKYE
ncbi:lytic transglycosylase [Ktedonobacter robiniae]|uniref:lytic transglycosylase n=1 Tax=Ktedonobacter robiniae TaxID=2778365 RepID=UPI001916718D|nr:LysM peptidoglycan-binding domain-containing protein [Ktedonobacter robiniae]